MAIAKKRHVLPEHDTDRGAGDEQDPPAER